MTQQCRPETMKMTRRGGRSRPARASGPDYFHGSDEQAESEQDHNTAGEGQTIPAAGGE